MSLRLALTFTLLTAACGPNSPPEILRVTQQEAFVGAPFELTLKAADPDGDTIHWTYHAPTLNLKGRARLISLGNEARFSWTPIAPDVGDHVVDFVASDGETEDREAAAIRVKASTTSKTAPVFVRPLGEGTTLDLSKAKCIKQEVEVEDPDTPQVAFRLNPGASGASLKSTGAHRALLQWCPTSAQAAKQRHLLGLVADDNDNPPVTKNFTILLSSSSTSKDCKTTSDCPAGKVCGAMGCVAAACTPKDSNGDKLYWEQGTCPTGHFCPAAGPKPSPSACALQCKKSSECRATEVCKVLDTRGGCARPGKKTVGQSCTSYTDCAGIAMCLPWIGGYCSISDCSSSGGFSGKCPTGSVCVPVADKRFTSLGKHWICLQSCTSDSGCRTGHKYKCVSVKDDRSKSVKVCK